MSYFDDFRRILYNGKEAVDIIESIQLRYRPIFSKVNFYKHTLIDGERPLDISYKLYDDTKYHFLILLINNIVDPFYDWLLTAQELSSYIDEKYGNDKYKIHHFIDLNTNRIVDDYDHKHYQELIDNGVDLPLFISPVTNYKYEDNENEKKRNIIVISSDDIEQVNSDYMFEINGLSGF